MSNADKLRKAKALISSPDNWTQRGGLAADADDRTVGIYEPSAVRFCAEAACAVATDSEYLGDGVVDILDRAVVEATFGRQRTAAAYNDAPDTTHADIMALFDRAIVIAEDRV